MQIISVLSWLTIASIAMAVLPVFLSPMISSRWPRPIGTIASIAKRPVCTGSQTGWRSIIPGALNSIGRSCVVGIAPKPSIGTPSGLTTRPSIARPTGIDITCPVVRHSSPSRIELTSPNKTAPISSSSRFCARPYTLLPEDELVNCNSSPAIAALRPEI